MKIARLALLALFPILTLVGCDETPDQSGGGSAGGGGGGGHGKSRGQLTKEALGRAQHHSQKAHAK